MKYFLVATAFFITLSLLAGCEKRKLKVNEEKIYLQENHHSTSDFQYDAGWQLTLKPNGMADIIPSGDIVYRGTYQIKGSNLTVKSEQSTFRFKIISGTELKEVKYGVVLRLKTP